jgi:hypothetical protein
LDLIRVAHFTAIFIPAMMIQIPDLVGKCKQDMLSIIDSGLPHANTITVIHPKRQVGANVRIHGNGRQAQACLVFLLNS